MRKRGLIIIMLILLSGTAYAATITVNPGSSIQSAVSSANAGDTVLVKPGTYRESITISKGIILKSEELHKAIIEGTISIDGSDMTIDGFKFQNTGAYATIRGTREQADFRNVKILNNYMTRVGFGIWVDGIDWLVEGNEIYQLVMNGGDADYSRFHGTGHVFRNNKFWGTKVADIGQSHTDCFQTYSGNTKDILFENNFCSGFGQGIMAEALYVNDFQSGDFTFRNNVVVNYAEDGWGGPASRGLITIGIENVVIEHNTFITHATAAHVGGGTIKNNIFYGLEYGYKSSGQTGYNNFYQTTGAGGTDITSDPQFVDFNGRDYHLKSGSPACTSGEGGTYMGAYPCDGSPGGPGTPGNGGGSGGGGGSGVEGDVNEDGKVDIFDLVIVAQNFGSSTGFDERADLNGDNKVDIFDLVVVAQNFG